MSDKSQRTEKATPRRIHKARKQGQFISSRHLVSAVQFLAAMIFLSAFAGGWCIRVAKLMVDLLRRSARGELNSHQLIDLSRISLVETMTPLAIGGAAVVALVLVSQLFVTKFGLSMEKLTPNINKLNPMQKIKGMFTENITTFLQGLVLIPLLLYAAFYLFKSNLGVYMSLPRMSARLGTMLMADQVLSLMWKASTVFVVFGLVDYVRQRNKYLKGLKMSKQDIKDEVKETEGNMESKNRLKRLMRSLHRRRMLRDVKTATAVVVNPTHYSVALRYDPASGGAPVVVAKGKNRLALRIRAIATENFVPIIENPPLARGLYSSAEVGQEIPAHLYRAVAEILAHVFKLMSAYRPR